MPGRGSVVRSILAFLLLPGTVAYLLPWSMASGGTPGGGWSVGGALALVLGSVALSWCVRRFHVAGRGTLAPWDPPRGLVTSGPYEFTRNPMYLAVLIVLCGWALWFRSAGLALYGLIVAVAFHLRVVHFEEPRLLETFGPAWQEYRGRVPRWLPVRRG